ncbi:hypothetical protein GN277_01015 [Lachnospiraceae bacterium WCA-9-b2]|uniref:Uncharacterized protein n=1 Tax=Sporofaciens musculi TaxID=2681861 RepID=A0A7X3SH68_9FIRM|nr:hypothetical protein [Sporofaciens musculi]MXP74064.1 hypothetical protein [Sporofaciens musculi]
MGKEPDKKYKTMKKIMDALEDILCSYQGRGHQSVYVDLDSLALFTSLIAYRQIQVENYRYDYDDNIREDEKVAQIYRELAPQTRWRVGRYTQIEPIRMNALKQLSSLGMPTYQGQIYYADTGSVLVCGEILPYEIFQLFTDMPGLKKLYVFPYPFREREENPLYFSFKPTEAAREEMRKYVEKKMDEMCRIMREKSESISGIIPKVDEKDLL